MKRIDFLKEKLYFIIGAIVSVLLITIFLRVSHVSRSEILFIDMIFILFVTITLIIEFQRRYYWYQDLVDTLEALDKKYLINEVIEEPVFVDGKILYEVLSEVDKSMVDEVNTYKRAQQEYKEYVEMWVHEIKTPLASSNLLLDNHPSTISDTLKNELQKVERYVEQALFYAKSNAVEKDYVITKVSLSKLIHTIIKKHANSFIYRHISLQIEEIDEFVYADAKWLEFILDQILINALKYSHDNGTIRITTKRREQNVSLYIQDNGIGINAKDLPNIFEKGFTGSNGRTHEKSTGIGLYLCHKLCEKMYLSIHAESIEQVGTTMIITFPSGTMHQL